VVFGFWEGDIRGNLTLSEGNWPAIEGAAASERTIPKWSSGAPLN